MLKKLRIKFVCVIMTVVTVMLCVIFGMLIHSTNVELDAESQRIIDRLEGVPGKNNGLNKREDHYQLPYIVLQVDRQGNILLVTSYVEDMEYLQEILKAAMDTGKPDGELEQYSLIFSRSTTPVGISYVLVDISSQKTTMDNLIRTCLLVGIPGFLVLLGLSLLLARWVVKPVEQAWDQQRQFVADASHELKTPLTVILTNAEMLQDPDYDEEARSRSAGSILTMSHQMRGLVESLLELARVDNGTAKMSFAEVDYSTLVSDEAMTFEPLLFEKELMLESAIEEGIRLRGSESHLRQVVDILLDNAMKYAKGPNTVGIFLKRQGNHCLLTVANPGDPISPEDLKSIFKRFYRIDKARTRDGSYGLGLSIADSIVKEHRGKIWAESVGGINSFHILLPL